MTHAIPVDHSPVHDAYTLRVADCQKRIDHFSRLDFFLSWLRFLVFLSGIAAFFSCASMHRSPVFPLIAVALVFIFLVIVHGRLVRAKKREERLHAFYARGVARLEHRWQGLGESGQGYLEEGHPYIQDLDIFGPASLYELLCTARTRAGRDTLAAWLLRPAEPGVILKRQEAVRELAQKNKLREDLWTLVQETDDAASLAWLKQWAAARPIIISGRERACCVLLTALVLLTGGLWGASVFHVPVVLGIPTAVGRGLCLLFLALEALFSLRLKGRVQRIGAAAEKIRRGITQHVRILERLEAEPFSSAHLAHLHALLTGADQSASRRLRHFECLLDLFEDGQHNLAIRWSRIFFWSTHLAARIERWRTAHASAALQWINCVAEMEALSALATYAHEHPDDCFPQLELAAHGISGRGIAHSLLAEGAAVRNDLELSARPSMLIVSGSNMAGKSTFLKAIGVNAVLALAGAPVRARAFKISPLALFAILRTRDSLQQGISRFYDEILRMKEMVQFTKAGQPVLFLIDEIFSGTNSHDRLLATQAIMRIMQTHGALGMITTHDLTLTQLAQDLDGQAANAHFGDQLVGGELRFDYRLKPGVVQKSNALLLMRSIGLEV